MWLVCTSLSHSLSFRGAGYRRPAPEEPCHVQPLRTPPPPPPHVLSTLLGALARVSDRGLLLSLSLSPSTLISSLSPHECLFHTPRLCLRHCSLFASFVSVRSYVGDGRMAVDDSPGGRHVAAEVARLTAVERGGSGNGSTGYEWHTMGVHGPPPPLSSPVPPTHLATVPTGAAGPAATNILRVNDAAILQVASPPPASRSPYASRYRTARSEGHGTAESACEATL